MSDTEEQLARIAEYERRISYALDRIGRGVSVLRGRAEKAETEARAAGSEATLVTETEETVVFTASPEPDDTEATAEDAAPAAPENAVEHTGEYAALAAEQEIVRLRAALAAEQNAKAELAEGVRAIREKQETTLGAMEQKLTLAGQARAAAMEEAARLKRANLELVEANRALLAAAGDPAAHLVNAALQAELDTLRAVRAGESVELGAILEGLEPLIAAHAKPEENGNA